MAADGTAADFVSSVRKRGGIAVLTLRGTMGRGNEPELNRTLHEALQRPIRWVIVDVKAAVPDRYGIGVIALIRRRVCRYGLRFAVVTACPDLTGRLSTARIRPGFPIYPSVEVAVDATGSAPGEGGEP